MSKLSSRPSKRLRRFSILHQLFLNVFVLDDDTDEATVQMPERHPVLKILYEDISCGIGLREAVVLQRYEEISEKETNITLQERVSELTTELKNHHSTVKHSCRIWNLFLVSNKTYSECSNKPKCCSCMVFTNGEASGRMMGCSQQRTVRQIAFETNS